MHKLVSPLGLQTGSLYLFAVLVQVSALNRFAPPDIQPTVTDLRRSFGDVCTDDSRLQLCGIGTAWVDGACKASECAGGEGHDRWTGRCETIPTVVHQCTIDTGSSYGFRNCTLIDPSPNASMLATFQSALVEFYSLYSSCHHLTNYLVTTETCTLATKLVNDVNSAAEVKCGNDRVATSGVLCNVSIPNVSGTTVHVLQRPYNIGNDDLLAAGPVGETHVGEESSAFTDLLNDVLIQLNQSQTTNMYLHANMSAIREEHERKMESLNERITILNKQLNQCQSQNPCETTTAPQQQPTTSPISTSTTSPTSKWCPAGHVPDTSHTRCDACPMGQYSKGKECVLCPAGTYNPYRGQGECFDVPPGGQFYSTDGSQSYFTCGSGLIANGEKTGCNECPVNTYEFYGRCIKCQSTCGKTGVSRAQDCKNPNCMKCSAVGQATRRDGTTIGTQCCNQWAVDNRAWRSTTSCGRCYQDDACPPN